MPKARLKYSGRVKLAANTMTVCALGWDNFRSSKWRLNLRIISFSCADVLIWPAVQRNRSRYHRCINTGVIALVITTRITWRGYWIIQIVGPTKESHPRIQEVNCCIDQVNRGALLNRLLLGPCIALSSSQNSWLHAFHEVKPENAASLFDASNSSSFSLGHCLTS